MFSAKVRLFNNVQIGKKTVKEFKADYRQYDERLTEMYQSGRKTPKIGTKIGKYTVINKTSDETTIYLEVLTTN